MKTSKVIILRGLPGSGKSTWAGRQRNAEIFSADDFWIQADGSYRFDGKLLQEAHSSCLRRFLSYVTQTRHYRNLIVDNTNLRGAHLAPYAAIADAYDCDLEVRTFEIDPDTSFKRNVHGVPLDKIRKMYNQDLEDVPWPWSKKQVFPPDEDLQ